MFGTLNSLGNLSSLGMQGNAKRLQLSELFSNNTEGIYLPSLRDDVSRGTMYQDSTGSIPVTGVEQPVGLILEGSKGVELGPELVTNGDFSDGLTGWAESGGSGDWAWSNGRAVDSGTAGITLNQAVTTVAGKVYVVSATAYNVSGGNPSILVGGAIIQTWANGTSELTANKVFVASSTSTTISFSGAVAFWEVDNISVREIKGNHLIQPTDADRPILSARVNMLENTEDLTASSWLNNGVNRESNKIITLANYDLHLLAYQTQYVSDQAYVVRAKLKYIDQQYVFLTFRSSWGNIASAVFDLINGQIHDSVDYGLGELIDCSITAQGDSFICTIKAKSTEPSGTGIIYVGFSDGSLPSNNGYVIYTPSSETSFYCTELDLRSADQATGLLPDYQYVGDVDTDPTDYDYENFPWYLSFNGVNTWMKVEGMTPNSDEVFACTGVRKASDDASGIVIEHTENVDNGGAFFIQAPSSAGSNSYRFYNKGTSGAGAGLGGFAEAPDTAVLQSIAKIGSDKCELYRNGSIVGSSTADMGSGNYTNGTLYIGSRTGSAFFLNGNIYSLILAFKIPSNRVIPKVERLVNQNTRAY